MTDWEIVYNQALKCFEANITWTSLGGNVNYKIRSISETKIKLIRLNGGKDEDINLVGVNKAIAKLRQQGEMHKSQLMGDVIRQTALVFLHPSIKYNQENNKIYWQNISNNIETIIKEANDDELEKILILVNKRKNQNLFKTNLIKKFKGKCAISETSVCSVLEAAHIISHSKSGINSSSNGILLRSDIHKLFDENLILINPKNLQVIIHKSIINSIYYEFNHKKLNIVVDKEFKENLKSKWEEANRSIKDFE